jgi:hypothetical protein
MSVSLAKRFFSSDNAKTSLSRAMPDVGNFNDLVAHNPIDDTIPIPGGQKGAIATEGVPHGWAQFGKIQQEFEFIDDLVLR